MGDRMLLISLGILEEPGCELLPLAGQETPTVIRTKGCTDIDGIETKTIGNTMINTGEALLETSHIALTRVMETREITLHHEILGMVTEANTLHTAEKVGTETEALLDTMETGEETLHSPQMTRAAGEEEEEVLTPLTEEVLTHPLDKRILSQRPRVTEMRKIAITRTQL